MTFKLVQRNSCKVPVRGVLKADDGKMEKFEFNLVCRRLGAAELKSALDDKERSVIDFVQSLAEGWSGVKDEDGNEIPFNQDALAQLLDVPGVARLAFDAYLVEQGAREKN
ncbi:MAG: hypothetical protein RL758_348 [Pseudomonadota bacterium]|jgi:hypothetical protein